jgi:hypothetical protein
MTVTKMVVKKIDESMRYHKFKTLLPNYALPKMPRVLVTMEPVRTLEKSIRFEAWTWLIWKA